MGRGAVCKGLLKGEGGRAAVDFQDRSFESFQRCAVDPARVELDRRIIADLLALRNEARIRFKSACAAGDCPPSIHGGKEPALPT